jgi:hypothetical protein
MMISLLRSFDCKSDDSRIFLALEKNKKKTWFLSCLPVCLLFGGLIGVSLSGQCALANIIIIIITTFVGHRISAALLCGCCNMEHDFVPIIHYTQ